MLTFGQESFEIAGLHELHDHHDGLLDGADTDQFDEKFAFKVSHYVCFQQKTLLLCVIDVRFELLYCDSQRNSSKVVGRDFLKFVLTMLFVSRNDAMRSKSIIVENAFVNITELTFTEEIFRVQN